MSRALLRSAFELRASVSRPLPSFLVPSAHRRFFNTTKPIIEPNSSSPSWPPPPPIAEPVSTVTAAPARTRPSSKPVTPSRAPQPRPRQCLDPSPRARYSAPVLAESPADEPHPSVRALLPILAAQPSHYITVHVFDKPYLVTRGDQVRLPFLMRGVLPGDVLRLNRASLLGSRDYTLKGAPYIDERLFECRATVLGSESEPLRMKIKKKQRNRRVHTIKSKHRYTLLRISDLKISQPEAMSDSQGKAGGEDGTVESIHVDPYTPGQ